MPIPANAFSTSADVRQTLWSFKLGKALEAARVAKQGGEQEVQRSRQVTAASLYTYADSFFSARQQRPMYKSHVRSMTPIRRCHSRPRRSAVAPRIFIN